MVGLIGRKIGMTQVFDENGMLVPVSVIQAGPCPVVQVRTVEKNGYNAVQLAFDEIRPSRVNLPTIGHFRGAGLPPYRHLQEFRIDDPGKFQAGQVIGVDLFKDVVKVDIAGRTKGRGFQGVVKRHKIRRGPKTHGSKSYRVVGSIGQSAFPSRVFKGKRMPGRMGFKRFTIRNLKVVDVDTNNNILLVRGAVPGARNTILRLTASPSA